MKKMFTTLFGTKPTNDSKTSSRTTSKADDDKHAAGGQAAVTKLLSVDEFDAFIKVNKFVVVKFGWPECKPCREIMPHFHAALVTNRQVRGADVHAIKLEELADRYQLKSYPSFLFFKRGQLQKPLSIAAADQEALGKNIVALQKR